MLLVRVLQLLLSFLWSKLPRGAVLEELLEEYGESPEALRVMLEPGDNQPEQFSTPQQLGRATSVKPSAPARERRSVRAPEFQIHGTGDATPESAADTLEGRLADMERQLRQQSAEQAAYRLSQSVQSSGPSRDENGASVHSPASLASNAEVMAEAIGKAMVHALEGVVVEGSHSSFVNVKPEMRWPTLTDEDDNTHIGIFFKELEEMFAIDNGGKGTNHAERLVYLRMC